MKIEKEKGQVRLNELKTLLLRAYDVGADAENIALAGEILKKGGIVAIPTETVYGLAADATNPEAVSHIFEAKGRPKDNPLIIHIDEFGMMTEYVREIPDSARRLAEKFWPGPLTMILPKTDKIPMRTSGGLDTVAVRMPSNPIAKAVIRAAGVPLAAPSANRSGLPSTTTYQHCVHDLDGRVDAILESYPCQYGLESTVITLAEGTPRLLRPGAVTLEQLREVLGTVDVDKGVTEHLDASAKVSSPGMKYKHYAPEADVVLVKGTSEEYLNYLKRKAAPGVMAICFDEDLPNLPEGITGVGYGAREDHYRQGALIFDLLRKVDEQQAKKVYVHCPEQDGMGLAVYNRLIRSAGFQVEEAGDGE